MPTTRIANKIKPDANTANFQGAAQVPEAAASTLTTDVMAGAGTIFVTYCVTKVPPTVVTEAMVVGTQDVIGKDVLASVGEVDNAINVSGIGDNIKDVAIDDVRDDAEDDTAVNDVDGRVDDVADDVVDDVVEGGSGELIDDAGNDGDATGAVVKGTGVGCYIKVLAWKPIYRSLFSVCGETRICG